MMIMIVVSRAEIVLIIVNLIIEFGPCPSLGPRIVLFTEPRDYDDYYYDDYYGQARKNYNYKWSGEQKL